MDRLWTPWRMAFIEQATSAEGAGGPACFLCAKPSEPPARDADNLILYRGRQAYVLMNLYPYNPGHLMVVPYDHTADLPALPAAAAAELMSLAQTCMRVMQDELRPQGFNLGMNLGRVGGAGIDEHLHLHIVPRWNGDTNFMPLIGGVKLLPEGIDDTYAALLPFFEQVG